MSGGGPTQRDDAGDGLAGIERTLGAIELIPRVGSLIRYLVEWFPAVQRRQAHDLLAQLLELIGAEPETVLDRLTTNEPLMRLFCDAARAAAAADSADMVRALAHAAAQGAIDDAKLDEAAYLVAGRVRGPATRPLALRCGVVILIDEVAGAAPGQRLGAGDGGG
jgi:hypothetical protein